MCSRQATSTITNLEAFIYVLSHPSIRVRRVNELLPSTSSPHDERYLLHTVYVYVPELGNRWIFLKSAIFDGPMVFEF